MIALHYICSCFIWAVHLVSQLVGIIILYPLLRGTLLLARFLQDTFLGLPVDYKGGENLGYLFTCKPVKEPLYKNKHMWGMRL